MEAIMWIIGIAAVLASASLSYQLGKRKPPVIVAAPETRPALSAPDRNLPTRTERWMQEQEHILYPNRKAKQLNHTACRVCGPGPLGRNEVPSVYDHEMLNVVYIGGSYGGYWITENVTDPSHATAISSKIEGHDLHTIMLDIDRMPARLVESSTPGNHHLYIDHPVPWSKYIKFIEACADIGIVEREFYKAAKRNKATHLRPPWIEKEDD